MSKFNIEIIKTLSHIYEIEADSLEEALEKVKGKYFNGEIVLDENDHVDTDFFDRD